MTDARARAISASSGGGPKAVAVAEDAVSKSLRSLFAVAENYPTLRAVESFTALQEQLDATEDKIEYARRYYNTAARDYNSSVQSFPGLLIAGPLKFHTVEFFQTPETDRDAPQVSFTSRPTSPAA